MLPAAPGLPPGCRSASLPVQELVLRESVLGPGDGVLRPSRRRLLIVTLSGEAEIRVHGGGTRRFCSGDMLLAEDLGSSGHCSREIAGPRRALVLAVPAEFDLRTWAAPGAQATARG